MIDTINKIQSICHQVILLIDTNESFHSLEHGISSLIEHIGMINPIANKHGTNNQTNTYKRGSQIINYILYINRLTPFVQHCGILPFDMIITLDHSGLFIDIDLALFFKDLLHQFTQLQVCSQIQNTFNEICTTTGSLQ